MTILPKLHNRACALFAGAFLALTAIPASAQIDQNAGASAVGAGSTPSAVIQDDQRGAERGAQTLRQDQISGRRPAPFGSELFRQQGDQSGQGLSGSGAGSADPNHIVQPGDVISVTE